MKTRFSDYLKRIGCLATFLFALALYFVFGLLATLLNGDMWGTLQSIFLTSLCIVGAILLARRHRRVEGKL